MTVQLADSNNNSIPNAPVNFSIGNHPKSMAVQIHPTGAQPVTVVTGQNGHAVLNKMLGSSVSAYYSAGQFKIVVSVAGGGNVQLSFTVTS